MRRGLRKDFSWRTSAAEYAALYRKLLDDGQNAESSSRKKDPMEIGR